MNRYSLLYYQTRVTEIGGFSADFMMKLDIFQENLSHPFNSDYPYSRSRKVIVRLEPDIRNRFPLKLLSLSTQLLAYALHEPFWKNALCGSANAYGHPHRCAGGLPFTRQTQRYMRTKMRTISTEHFVYQKHNIHCVVCVHTHCVCFIMAQFWKA